MPWEWGGRAKRGPQSAVDLASAARSEARSPRPGEAGKLGPRCHPMSASREGGTRSEAEEEIRLEGGGTLGHLSSNTDLDSRGHVGWSGDCSEPQLLHGYKGPPMSLGS